MFELDMTYCIVHSTFRMLKKTGSISYLKSSVLILDGDPARSFRCGNVDEDVSIGVGASGFLFVVNDIGDDFRSTLTKLDEVTVTLGSNGMILAGLSFKDDAVDDVAVVEVADEVAANVGDENDFSMVSPDGVGRSGSVFPVPTLPNPGWL